jgi:hypothetical protein
MRGRIVSEKSGARGFTLREGHEFLPALFSASHPFAGASADLHNAKGSAQRWSAWGVRGAPSAPSCILLE